MGTILFYLTSIQSILMFSDPHTGKEFSGSHLAVAEFSYRNFLPSIAFIRKRSKQQEFRALHLLSTPIRHTF
jgi:hypothetical protein